jgi:ribonuclease HI
MTAQVVIYTDGACAGNPGPGGWGYIVLNAIDKAFIRRSCGGEKATTNNRMELMAAISALESFEQNRPESITIITDSKYVLQGITEWIKGWKKNGWMGSNKTPVKNKDLWERLETTSLKYSNLKWVWVKGHSGNIWNDAVDELAVSGIPKD